MNTIYDSLEGLARHESNNQEKFAKLTIEKIESAYNQGQIDLVEKSQLLDILPQ